jgi:hypothetical protein
VANKASGIYADYLEEDDARKIAIYQAGIKRAEQAIEAYPDDANAHYFHAFLLGRYSQCISMAQALAQGVGGKIKASLEKALKLAPDCMPRPTPPWACTTPRSSTRSASWWAR